MWAVRCLLIFCIALPLKTGTAQNVETSKSLILKIPSRNPARQFGASLAAKHVKGGNTLVVGAPSGGTHDGNAYPGEVFQCLVPTTLGEDICSSTVSLSKAGSMGISVSSNGDQFSVCGNRHVKNCQLSKLQQRMTGACFSYNSISGSATELTNPCPQACPNLEVDILFILDESGSVKLHNYQTAKEWIVKVSKGLETDINAGFVRVGLITFNGNTRLRINLNSRTYSSFASLVRSVSYREGGTRTDLAIDRALVEFNSNSARVNIPKVAIVVTDGESNKPSLTVASAEQARAQGVVMVSVGVGVNIIDEELLDIAGSPDRKLKVDSFDQLDTILATLTNVIKESALAGLEGSSNVTNELYQCQLGSSAYHDKVGNFFTGAVGAFDRVGSVAEYQTSGSLTGSLDSKELSAIVEPENATLLRESYLGYSVSSGRFASTSQDLVVSGMPRYQSRGQVLFYPPNTAITSATSNLYSLHPLGKLWQIGAYFGHSVLAIDLNKDNYDDLIVSAPLYSDVTGFDQGRVFVYMNDPANPGPLTWKRETPISLVGSNQIGSRFGYSLGTVGDIDQNGYNDVIIGAPTEDATSLEGSGAVYVYYLSASGISDQRKQKIQGRSFSVFNFGASVLSGNRAGLFVDTDNYPDVVAGAPSSDKVVVLRSRPIIEVTARLTLTNSKVNVKACASSNVSCSTLNVCLSASYRNDVSNHVIGINATLDLDSLIGQASVKRFVFFGAQDTVRRLNLVAVRTESCIPYPVQINPKAYQDPNVQASWFKVIPRAKLTFDLTDAHKNTPFSGVLDPVASHYTTADWLFENGCQGGKCTHDLRLQAQTSITASNEPVILSKFSGTMTMSVTISNEGPDNSYFTKVNITSGTLSRAKVTGSCVRLLEEDSTPGHTVLAYVIPSQSLSDLMAPKDRCQFTVEYDLRSLTTHVSADNITFHAVIYSNVDGSSSSVDPDPTNNQFNFFRQVRYSASLVLGGSASVAEVVYNRTTDATVASSVFDQILGSALTNIEHTHLVNGRGPLAVKTTQLTFTWPAQINNGLPLFYLYKFSCLPSTRCTCTTSNQINPHGLSLAKGTEGKNVSLTFPEPTAVNLVSELSCGSGVSCGTIRCTLNDLAAQTKVTVAASFKIWLPTLSPENVDSKFFSEIQVNTSNLPLHPAGGVSTNKVSTRVLSSKPSSKENYKPQGSNIGAIIGGIIGGIALLAIVVLVLWKTGFFESKYGEMMREARRTVRREANAVNQGYESIH